MATSDFALNTKEKNILPVSAVHVHVSLRAGSLNGLITSSLAGLPSCDLKLCFFLSDRVNFPHFEIVPPLSS